MKFPCDAPFTSRTTVSPRRAFRVERRRVPHLGAADPVEARERELGVAGGGASEHPLAPLAPLDDDGDVRLDVHRRGGFGDMWDRRAEDRAGRDGRRRRKLPPRSIRAILSHGITAVWPVASSTVAWSFGIASTRLPRIIPPPFRYTTSDPTGAARGTVTAWGASGSEIRRRVDSAHTGRVGPAQGVARRPGRGTSRKQRGTRRGAGGFSQRGAARVHDLGQTGASSKITQIAGSVSRSWPGVGYPTVTPDSQSHPALHRFVASQLAYPHGFLR